MPEDLVLCYHKGCGQQYKESENKKDSCTYHPGVPVFHDAYKGWSCCDKKYTDFTEFLNIKGCATDFHSNEKPPEPAKPERNDELPAEVVEVRQPVAARLPRPPLDTPLTTMKPNVAPSLISQLKSLDICNKSSTPGTLDTVALGTTCKHGGCKAEYQGPDGIYGPCIHHPGVPVFHEGLKFWSCCTKRTTDFAAFLEQVGCTSGQHQWTVDQTAIAKPVCRHDWHQTGTHVIISIYAKKYDPNQSSVQLSPIRAKIDIMFPETGLTFNMDLELRGIIDVERSEVEMLGTKIEIKLRKAEPGSWLDLYIPKKVKKEEPKPVVTNVEQYDDESVDLSDL